MRQKAPWKVCSTSQGSLVVAPSLGGQKHEGTSRVRGKDYVRSSQRHLGQSWIAAAIKPTSDDYATTEGRSLPGQPDLRLAFLSLTPLIYPPT